MDLILRRLLNTIFREIRVILFSNYSFHYSPETQILQVYFTDVLKKNTKLIFLPKM